MFSLINCVTLCKKPSLTHCSKIFFWILSFSFPVCLTHLEVIECGAIFFAVWVTYCPLLSELWYVFVISRFPNVRASASEFSVPVTLVCPGVSCISL